MEHERIFLGRRGIRSLMPAADTQLTVTRGSAWITVDGDPQDHVLEAGESFTAPAGVRTVVYAFEVSTLSARRAEPSAAGASAARGVRTTAQVAV